MIITIDGPAGSGKSTVARALAGKLNIAYLDTGATYRAVTLAAIRAGVDLNNEAALAKIVRDASIEQVTAENGVRILLNGRDVSREIRSPEVTEKSHFVARSPSVRKVLVNLQRRIGRRLGSFVTEGRDQGSVAFPDADVKFYLDASAAVRAKRRHKEMIDNGHQASYEDILGAILERDRRDRTRTFGPLVKPTGAIVIDTSDMTVEQAATELFRHVEAAR